MVWLFSHIQLEPIFEFFFFNDTATTEIYTLSLHDALPICAGIDEDGLAHLGLLRRSALGFPGARSEEHTSELQSHLNLVCRLLLEKKKRVLHPSRNTPPSKPPTEHSMTPIQDNSAPARLGL